MYLQFNSPFFFVFFFFILAHSDKCFNSVQCDVEKDRTTSIPTAM